MKKFIIVLVMFGVGVVSAQVDTFCLHNMPKDYYLENWPNYSEFQHVYHHDDGSICSIGAPSAIVICQSFPGNLQCRVYGFKEVLDSNLWDQPHIKSFAAGKHADSTIRVVGIAMLYPKYHCPGERSLEWDFGWDKGTRVVEELLARDFDVLRLQLMDSNMNVLAAGTTRLEDSVGRPLFVFNKERMYEVYPHQYMYSMRHDIYEVFFNTPIAVSDSFYLEAHFENSAHTKDNFAFSLPNILEEHFEGCTADFAFPKFTWKARGGYRYLVNPNISDATEPVPGSVWFTVENCEENHGFMLIFPILEVVCGAPEGVSVTPMGGGRVLLRWDTGQWGTSWEVSYGPVGTQPGDGRVVTTDEATLLLSGISADTSYVAFVRAQCTARDTVWSDWSDSVNFGKRLGVEAAEGMVAVEVAPNPTGGTVVLTADVAMTGVTAYAADGRQYVRLAATGREQRLDVTAWPTGTYTLVVDTERGPVVRRLTVAR